MSIENERARLTALAHRRGVPENCIDGLVEYVLVGRPTGSFLEAVLSNDLMDAMARADAGNRYRVFEIASWLYNDAPGDCYGSRSVYSGWIAAGGLAGAAKAKPEGSDAI